MAAKGSKYARKHNVEIIEEPEKEEGAFLEVIYDDYDYLKTFNYLPLPEQIKAYQTLKKLAETNKPRNRELTYKSKEKLNKINESAGMERREMLCYPLSPDEHHLIRMDCYGTIDSRPTHQLSKFYKEFLKKPMAGKLPVTYYNFDLSPSWQLFRQFENFRSIETDLKIFLSKNHIHPDVLKVMGVRDFSDLIFRAFQKNPTDMKVSFVEESERNLFVKQLATEHGDQITRILYRDGIDERYIASLINAMKLYGATDSEKITITELYFTPQVLTSLRKADIPVEDYDCGDKIPQDLINYLISHDKGLLLAARDDNGDILEANQFPSFEVHHKVAVSEGGQLPLIAAANYASNFLLVEKNIHHYVLHGSDKLMVANGKESYRCRMEFKEEGDGYIFMYGFNSETQLKADLTNTIAYQKRMRDDIRYQVSYEDVMLQLNENRKHFCHQEKTKPEFDVDGVVRILRHKYNAYSQTTKK